VLSTAALHFENVTQKFERYTAIANIDLEAPSGAFVSVVGPSGCGKSTLLNLAAGLIQPTEGAISVLGEPLRGINRKASYMFQQDGLLPWKTAIGNIELGLKFRGIEATEAAGRAREWAARVGLEKFADAYPGQLSGGMRKRVAMAQSWIVDPDILLMDEPFSHLDAITARRMRFDLMGILASAKPTILFVTHDLAEAVFLSDSIYLMSSRPARIFKRVAIDIPRPRKPEDSTILDLEKTLVRDFFSVVEANG
jgi:NitT/TauT family transport system ATP-binding protein